MLSYINVKITLLYRARESSLLKHDYFLRRIKSELKFFIARSEIFGEAFYDRENSY